MSEWTNLLLSRRACLPLLAAATVMAPPGTWSPKAQAQGSNSGFDQWVAAFRARARASANPYGDGHAAPRIVDVLRAIPVDARLVQKRFSE